MLYLSTNQKLHVLSSLLTLRLLLLVTPEMTAAVSANSLKLT